MHSAYDSVRFLGVFNGLMGRHSNEFDGAHRGCDVGQRNLEESILLELCLWNEYCVSNTWLKR